MGILSQLKANIEVACAVSDDATCYLMARVFFAEALKRGLISIGFQITTTERGKDATRDTDISPENGGNKGP